MESSSKAPAPPARKLPRPKGYRRLNRAPKQVLRMYRLTLDPPLVGPHGTTDHEGGLREQRAKFLAARRARRTGATA
jgi:hypothetical protein